MTSSLSRTDILGRIALALRDAQVLRDEASYRVLLSQVGDRLRQRFHPDDIVSVVHTLADHPSGIASLIDILAELEGPTDSVRLLRLLQSELDALDLFTEEDLLPLRELLHGQPIDMDAIAAAFPLHMLAGQRDAWPTFLHLSGYNSGPDGVPPCMAFVERVADRADADVAAALRSWNDRMAERFALTTQLSTVRRQTLPPGGGAAGIYLTMALEPDPLDSDIIRLSHWVQRGPGTDRLERGEDNLVTLADLPARTEELVKRIEATAGPAVTLEFVVPLALLNEPIARWFSDDELPSRHQVVVRSLERLRTPSLHLNWRRRWRQLKDDPTPQVLWARGTHGSMMRLSAELSLNYDVGCLVLSNPPAADSYQEIAVGLRMGIPVIMWHRHDCSTKAFSDTVSRLAEGPLHDLPTRLHDLRRRARPDERASEDVVVLWDDADRLAFWVDGRT
ncbi:hypothetical protein [Kutzneria buriramensis]|uniref:Uncharacterized protein n=1 Tax=Kutzneria buriramensis TaxID=1045776 RepID=A0A3E0GXC9_9PSEU|nr:hypothetical protein [Kutzneria buriramensis]REH29598.1 hypothetical protein BCF44_12425 [Kutzneria buriramensis]